MSEEVREMKMKAGEWKDRTLKREVKQMLLKRLNFVLGDMENY